LTPFLFVGATIAGGIRGNKSLGFEEAAGRKKRLIKHGAKSTCFFTFFLRLLFRKGGKLALTRHDVYRLYGLNIIQETLLVRNPVSFWQA